MVSAIEANSFEPEIQEQCPERNDRNEDCRKISGQNESSRQFLSYLSCISLNCSHPLEKESIKSLLREQQRGISRIGLGYSFLAAVKTLT